MGVKETEALELVLGTFICPNTKLPVELKVSRAEPIPEWPMVVKRCGRCGQEHVVQIEDLRNPPVFGYE